MPNKKEYFESQEKWYFGPAAVVWEIFLILCYFIGAVWTQKHMGFGGKPVTAGTQHILLSKGIGRLTGKLLILSPVLCRL